MGISVPDSWKAEVYTEEDETLLGDCETPWTLNVDGLGEDGEPLYDPVHGTSCHQCRSTLDYNLWVSLSIYCFFACNH